MDAAVDWSFVKYNDELLVISDGEDDDICEITCPRPATGRSLSDVTTVTGDENHDVNVSPVKPSQPPVKSSTRVDCGICGAKHQRRRSIFLGCGHGFGSECLVARIDRDKGFTCFTCKKEFSWWDRIQTMGIERYVSDGKKFASISAGPLRSLKGAERELHQGLKDVRAWISKIDTVYSARVTSKSKKKAKSSANQPKTAWVKGTGFGGSRGSANPGPAILKAQQREARFDSEIECALQNFRSILVQHRTVGTHTAHTMALQHLLERSQLERLLCLLLRNDSLMDITGPRAKLYLAVLSVVEELSVNQSLCGVLDGNCRLKHAIKALVKTDSSLLSPNASGKRPASDNLSEDEHDDDDELDTRIPDLLKQLNRLSKLFIKQCNTAAVSMSGNDLSSVDPSGVAAKIQECYTIVQENIKKRDPSLREISDRNEVLSSETQGVLASQDMDSCTCAVEEEYLTSMKGLLFRMVKLDHDTHSYHREIYRSTKTALRRDRLKRITREMSSLSSSLPLNFASSVFVRVDETRPDVLKALIIGPEGTPYENGVFIFDIFLPSEYPQKPPKVILITTNNGRTRFNPNLYADGKVCLSLLGTWDGPGWIPASSTLLQVLLSIQSLILVDQPYFNEPGFENRPSAAVESAEYNQSLQYQTMMVAMKGALQTSCPVFQSVVQSHFRMKRDIILKQCEQWISAASDSASPASSGAFGGFFGMNGGGGHHQVPYASKAHLQSAHSQLKAALASLHVDSITIS